METTTSPGNGHEGAPQADRKPPMPNPAVPDGPSTLPLGPGTSEGAVPASVRDGEPASDAVGQAATRSTTTTPVPWKAWSQDDCTPTDYRTYKQGDTSPFNTTITRVFGRGRDFLVYANNSGGLAIHFNDPLPVRMRPALQEYRRLTTLATIALDTDQREKARELIATGLIHAFTSAEGTDVLAGMAPAKAFIESRAVAARGRTSCWSWQRPPSLCSWSCGC